MRLSSNSLKFDSKLGVLVFSLISGVFTAPRAGVYLITFSFYTYNDPSELTNVYLHLNGASLVETQHATFYYGGDVSGRVLSTGGRAVYLRLGAGDTLTLQTGTLTGQMGRIMFCVEFKQ